MHILLVEDDQNSGCYLRKGLTEAGFTVDWMQTGVDGLHAGISTPYDLIILDVMLPIMDGWQVLAAWRAANMQTFVIMLTARDRIDDKVKGLELGADDYLIKPFSFIELLARIKALLRRNTLIHQPNNSQLVIANLTLDVQRRKVYRGDKQVLLTSKEYSLLALLMRYPVDSPCHEPCG